MTSPRATHASEQDRAAAVAFCAGRDVACPGCGYNLRDSVDGVCSECGRVLTLRTKDVLVDRRHALKVFAAWNLLLSVTILGVEGAGWLLAGGRMRSYSVDDAIACVLLVLMLAHGVIVGLGLLLTTDERPLAHPRLWLRLGWGLWGGCLAFVVWDAFWLLPAILGADC